MWKGSRQADEGLTLVEVTLAVAIFAIVIALASQALMSFYVGLDIQEQRVEAMRVCKDLMGAVRTARRDHAAGDFDALTAWVEAKNEEMWAEFYRYSQDHEELKDQAISVECALTGGGLLEVRAACGWTDRAGRRQELQLTTLLARE